MNTKNIVLIAVVIVVIAAGVFWYVTGKKPVIAPVTPTAQTGLGGDIYGQVAPNAAQNLPETNPFKAVQTNPFSQ